MFQNWDIPSTNSSLFLGFTSLRIYSFSSCHKFSLGLQSGDFFHQLMSWPDCLGLLSCIMFRHHFLYEGKQIVLKDLHNALKNTYTGSSFQTVYTFTACLGIGLFLGASLTYLQQNRRWVWSWIVRHFQSPICVFNRPLFTTRISWQYAEPLKVQPNLLWHLRIVLRLAFLNEQLV